MKNCTRIKHICTETKKDLNNDNSLEEDKKEGKMAKQKCKLGVVKTGKRTGQCKKKPGPQPKPKPRPKPKKPKPKIKKVKVKWW
ncbi:hypothetical protein KAT24_00720 [Candidatus Pacearchaeota archaeon]|nr:hypothetical protein [Candidatus Pacearchaeota archaeon]